MRTQVKKNKRSSFSFPRLISLAVVGGIGYGAWQSGLMEKAWAHLAGGHASNDAEHFADMLLNSPECAPYRAAILAYQGKPGSEEISARLLTLYRRGAEAGCKRSDLE